MPDLYKCVIVCYPCISNETILVVQIYIKGLHKLKHFSVIKMTPQILQVEL